MLDEIEAVAVQACEAGGRYLREQFGSDSPDAEYLSHDVKAAVDVASERRMLEVITSAFPDHAVYAEESGDVRAEGETKWIVDPLDGTNNFVSGMPSFATAVAVLQAGEPVCAVIYVPVLDDLYVARRDGGVTYNGQPVGAHTDCPLDRGTLVFVIGHEVKLHPERLETAQTVHSRLDDRCKRVIESWSPCVHWGLLSRGLLDGIVCYFPDDEEQLAGELLARESGLHSVAGENYFIGATTDEALSEVRSSVEPLLAGTE